MRVLLVDDEEELVTTLSERLDLRGVANDYATTGEQGLAYLWERDYDWVVLDMKMPGLGGLATLKAIKRSRPGARIIVITGHTSKEDHDAGLAAGADHYLLKPVDVDDLVALMKDQA
jgi:DNA-binding response OmpR family regulator